MHPSNLFQKLTGCYFLLSCIVAHASAYFVVTSPGEGTAWRVGAANAITWRKGVLDGINSFDIEMNRMGQDGVQLIAKNVPSTSTALNLFLQDVPPGDDYFLLFVNSTHGVLHTTSPKFSILSSSASTPNGLSLSSPISGAPTVTLSGTPNPTQAFATTYPAIANGVHRQMLVLPQAWSFGGVLLGCIFGILWILVM